MPTRGRSLDHLRPDAGARDPGGNGAGRGVRIQQHALDPLGDRLDFDRPGAAEQAPGALVVGGGVDVGQVGALAEEGRAEPKIGDDGAQLVPL